jgi:hypothetical protein
MSFKKHVKIYDCLDARGERSLNALGDVVGIQGDGFGESGLFP